MDSKLEDFRKRAISITADNNDWAIPVNMSVERTRDSNGNCSIMIRYYDTVIKLSNEGGQLGDEYEGRAQQLAEMLDKIANNYCNLTGK